jgi:hypothetical protein
MTSTKAGRSYWRACAIIGSTCSGVSALPEETRGLRHLCETWLHRSDKVPTPASFGYCELMYSHRIQDFSSSACGERVHAYPQPTNKASLQLDPHARRCGRGRRVTALCRSNALVLTEAINSSLHLQFNGHVVVKIVFHWEAVPRARR